MTSNNVECPICHQTYADGIFFNQETIFGPAVELHLKVHHDKLDLIKWIMSSIPKSIIQAKIDKWQAEIDRHEQAVKDGDDDCGTFWHVYDAQEMAIEYLNELL